MFEQFLLFLKRLFFATGYFSSGSYPKPLTAEEEAECLAHMQLGSRKAREKLICHNMRLVAHIAKKYAKNNDLEDMISIGSIGLIKGVETFSAEKGANLATYLARCIENEILMNIRANKRYQNTVYLQNTIGVDNDGNELGGCDIDGEVLDMSTAGRYVAVLFSDRLTIYDKYLTEVATLPDVSEARAVLMRDDGSAVLAGASGASLYLP